MGNVRIWQLYSLLLVGFFYTIEGQSPVAIGLNPGAQTRSVGVSIPSVSQPIISSQPVAPIKPVTPPPPPAPVVVQQVPVVKPVAPTGLVAPSVPMPAPILPAKPSSPQPTPVPSQAPIVSAKPSVAVPPVPMPAQPIATPPNPVVIPPTTPVLPVTPVVTASPSKPVQMEPVKQDKKDYEDEDKETEVGLSTLELEEPQGNWLFKRLWYERAENRFGKIRMVVDEIWSMRSDFFTKRTELDKTILDPFYLLVGVGQGEFREIIADIIKRLNKSQAAEGDLDEQERALLADLQNEKKSIDDIQKGIDAVLTLDHDVDLALSRLMEQVNRAREYERESWESLKNIARELSDKKAQDIFYHMETIWKNAKGVHRYIQGEFASHFNDLVKKITNEIGNIKQVVQQLKAKGIDFKDRADKLEESDKKAHEKAIEDKFKVAIEKEKTVAIKEDDDDKEPAPQGWLDWAFDIISTVGTLIAYPFHALMNLFS